MNGTIVFGTLGTHVGKKTFVSQIKFTLEIILRVCVCVCTIHIDKKMINDGKK